MKPSTSTAGVRRRKRRCQSRRGSPGRGGALATLLLGGAGAAGDARAAGRSRQLLGKCLSILHSSVLSKTPINILGLWSPDPVVLYRDCIASSSPGQLETCRLCLVLGKGSSPLAFLAPAGVDGRHLVAYEAGLHTHSFLLMG